MNWGNDELRHALQDTNEEMLSKYHKYLRLKEMSIAMNDIVEGRRLP